MDAALFVILLRHILLIIYAKNKQISVEKNHSIFMYMSNIILKEPLYKKLCDYMLK